MAASLSASRAVSRSGHVLYSTQNNSARGVSNRAGIDMSQVVIACISGYGGASSPSGITNLRDRIRRVLVPRGVPKGNIFRSSWNHGRGDHNATGAPNTSHIQSEINSRADRPSYLALIGHSFGGWAVCKVSRSRDPVADFVGLIDPVFGLANSLQEDTYPMGRSIVSWHQRNGIMYTPAGVVPCARGRDLVPCGHRNVAGAQNIDVSHLKHAGRPVVHTTIDDASSVTDQIVDRIMASFSILIRPSGKKDKGWSGSQLVTSVGSCLYIIRDGVLLEMDSRTLKHTDRSDYGWTNGRLISGENGRLYIVRGDALIAIDTKTLKPINEDSGWTHARLMASASNRIYLIRDELLIEMDSSTLKPTGRSDAGWKNATLMTGAGKSLYIVREGILIEMNTDTLKPTVYSDSGWEKAKHISSLPDGVLIVREREIIYLRKNGGSFKAVGFDWGWSEATAMATLGHEAFLIRNDELIGLLTR